MKIQVIVCDVCEDQSLSTARFTITPETTGESRSVDLCETHAAPLVELLRLEHPAAKAPPRPPRKTATRRGGTPFMTREEIAQAKAAVKK